MKSQIIKNIFGSKKTKGPKQDRQKKDICCLPILTYNEKCTSDYGLLITDDIIRP
jgi:hypothetical protein